MSYEVGDWVIGLGVENWGSGKIVGIAKLGASTPFYRIDFGHREYHLTAEELRPTDAPSES